MLRHVINSALQLRPSMEVSTSSSGLLAIGPRGRVHVLHAHIPRARMKGKTKEIAGTNLPHGLTEREERYQTCHAGIAKASKCPPSPSERSCSIIPPTGRRLHRCPHANFCPHTHRHIPPRMSCLTNTHISGRDVGRSALG